MKVLITGGAGFIGRALIQHAHNDGLNWDVTVYSRDEQKHAPLVHRFPWVNFVLGDICDQERLMLACRGQDAVIHAAALKYIPEGEINPEECVRVNVDGTRNLLHAVFRRNVERTVVISTDKACQPVNVYGATKFMVERLTSEHAVRSGLRMHTVRYGNILGSTGSVVPVWKRQLGRGGFITLTDPTMTRFWMSVQNAVDTILVALRFNGANGSTLVPRPKAMVMGDLAGCFADSDQVKIVGVRPGEKMHECLISAQETIKVRTIDGGKFTELVPTSIALTESNFGEPQTSASHSPWGGWVTREEVRAWAAMAEEV